MFLTFFKSNPDYDRNWGLLAREQQDNDTEREKLKGALQIFTELNMPREQKAVQNELNSIE